MRVQLQADRAPSLGPPLWRGRLKAGGDRGLWRDWPTEYSFARGADVFYQPTGEDVARSPYLLASARLCFQLPGVQSELPRPAEDWARGRRAEEQARRAVAVLVRGLNEIAGPAIRAMEEG